MKHAYYIHDAGPYKELRQTRFEALFKKGSEHPHDVCATWTTTEQWEAMKHYFSEHIRPIAESQDTTRPGQEEAL